MLPDPGRGQLSCAGSRDAERFNECGQLSLHDWGICLVGRQPLKFYETAHAFDIDTQGLVFHGGHLTGLGDPDGRPEAHLHAAQAAPDCA